MNKHNILGQRFGKLVVEKVKNRERIFCRCDCGRRSLVWERNLRSGNTRSCGCQQFSGVKKWNRRRKLGLIDHFRKFVGQRFGMLVVKSLSLALDKETRFYCQCDCGKKRWMLARDLFYHHAQSCGCGCGRWRWFLRSSNGRRILALKVALANGINYNAFWARMYRGWDIKEAVSLPLQQPTRRKI